MSLLQHAAIPVRSVFIDHERAHVPAGDKVLEAVTGYAPDGSDRFAGRTPRAAEDLFDRTPVETTKWGAAAPTQYFAGADPTTAAQLMRPVHPLATEDPLESTQSGRSRTGQSLEEAFTTAALQTPSNTKYEWLIDDVVTPVATQYPAPSLTTGGSGGGRSLGGSDSTIMTSGDIEFKAAESAWAAASALHHRPPTASMLAGAGIRSADPTLDPSLLRPATSAKSEKPLRIYSLQAFLMSSKNSDAVHAALNARLTLVYRSSTRPSPNGPIDAVVGTSLAGRFYEYTLGTASIHLTEVGYDLPKIRDEWNIGFAELLHTELRNIEMSNRHAAALASVPAHMPLRQTNPEDLRDGWLKQGRTSRREVPTAVAQRAWFGGGDREARHRETYEDTGLWYGAPERKPTGVWRPFEAVSWV